MAMYAVMTRNLILRQFGSIVHNNLLTNNICTCMSSCTSNVDLNAYSEPQWIN